jgi:hypothetical protein
MPHREREQERNQFQNHQEIFPCLIIVENERKEKKK